MRETTCDKGILNIYENKDFLHPQQHLGTPMFSSRTASWTGPGVLFLSTDWCDDVTLFVLSTSFNHFTIFGESIEFLPSLKPTPTRAVSNGMAKGARFKHYRGSWLQTSVGIHHTMTGRSGKVALWKQWYVGQSVPLRAISAREDVCQQCQQTPSVMPNIEIVMQSGN